MPTTAQSAVPWSITETPARTGGLPGSPVTLMIPPAACMSGSYPGCARCGPTAPYAPIAQYTMDGRRRLTSSNPRPSSSQSPGRRLSTKMSLRAASLRAIPTPWSVRRSIWMERLPAFIARNIALSAPQDGGPHDRLSSPGPGRSTLITSAPSAPSSWVQKGPATELVRSRTRMPWRGSWSTERWLPTGITTRILHESHRIPASSVVQIVKALVTILTRNGSLGSMARVTCCPAITGFDHGHPQSAGRGGIGRS